MKKTYYDILEIAPSASDETIRGAYRALAKKYHPDVTDLSAEEAERRMVEINAAFEVLSDPQSRKEYDDLLRRQQARDHGAASERQPKNAGEGSHGTGTATADGAYVRKTSGGCSGCFTKLIVAIVALALVIHFGVRKLRGSDSQEDPVSAREPAEQAEAVMNGPNISGSPAPTEPAPTYPYADAWEATVQDLLSSAASGGNLEEKYSLYADALTLQLFEASFKYRTYVYLHDGKEDQEYADERLKDAFATVELMLESFSEEAVADTYLILSDQWNAWMKERVNDLMYDFSRFINIEHADPDALWELFLTRYGGIEAFYGADPGPNT